MWYTHNLRPFWRGWWRKTSEHVGHPMFKPRNSFTPLEIWPGNSAISFLRDLPLFSSGNRGFPSTINGLASASLRAAWLFNSGVRSAWNSLWHIMAPWHGIMGLGWFNFAPGRPNAAMSGHISGMVYPYRIHGAARNMVCHGSHQYTPVMLACIPAPWIRHGLWFSLMVYHASNKKHFREAALSGPHLRSHAKLRTSCSSCCLTAFSCCREACDKGMPPSSACSALERRWTKNTKKKPPDSMY